MQTSKYTEDLAILHSLKDRNPDMKIILFGCMMQEQHVVDKIRKSYPFVDLVFGTHNIFKFAELFYEMLQSDQQIVDIWEGHRPDRRGSSVRNANIHLNPVLISCLAATISAATVLFHMCADGREAVNPEDIIQRG